DDQGKYLSRIDQIGRGPSEYIEITDFTASLKENNIVIYDDKQQKVLKYDLDGNFIDATRINYWPLGISFTPNQKELALVSPRPMEVYSNNHSIMVMDKSWKPKAQLIKHDIEDTEDYLKKSICFYTFFEYEDSLTLWESYCDTIFRITDDRKVIPRYHLDLGKDNMPHELAAYDEKFNHHITEYSIIDKVLESKHYLFISGIYKGYLKEIFCDKRSNECHNLVFNLSIKDHGFHNDIDGGAPFWPYGVVGNGWVFGSFQATDLQTYWTFDDYFDNMEVKYPERQKTLEAIVENSTIDSNPIIQLVKLK
ncbi:MAG: 6-bladed beta-propeller, partial [Bacteroidota bacterium]